MAILQGIRSKGPLLVTVIGLALFAFIAGDAWKVLQPYQSHDVGEINGESLSAQDFQDLVEEYTEVVKFTTGNSSLADEQSNQIKDEVWRNYVNNKLIENEAKKLGITVTNEEIQSIIDAGTHPILSQTPFSNPQTGVFDKDLLKKFLVDYNNMNTAQMGQQYADYYQRLYTYWQFIEKTLLQSRLQEKYQALVTNSILSNNVDVESVFEARANQTDFVFAAIPYTSIADSTITITDADYKTAYNKKKEQFRQFVETRNIKYIDVQVTASEQDRAALQQEMEEYTEQLQKAEGEYATLVRQSGSSISFADLLQTKNALPADVVARLDSVNVGGVYGPYFNSQDNTLNSFKKLVATTAPDSIKYCQILIAESDAAKTKQLADSIFTALKKGANFEEVASKYGQTGAGNWLASANYETAQLDGENLTYLNAVTSANQGELNQLELSQGTLIFKVLEKKAMTNKYKVAIVKRPIEFSKETYSKAYNEFSQFIAANKTLNDLVNNAEDAGYRIFDRADLYSSEHTIGGVRGTKDAIRWIFEAKKGDVSGLYECGESDHMMVVALAGIYEEGYRPLALVKEQLRPEIVREKKAEKIIADLKKNGSTTVASVAALPNASTDTIKHVTFSAPTYIPSISVSELAISAYSSIAKVKETSEPLKGNAAIYVVEAISQEKSSETLDKETEKTSIQNMYTRMASQFVSDLYLKAKVKDQRYLFF